MKPGCKVVLRPLNQEGEEFVEKFEDVVPSGVDSEGNEVSFDVFIGLQGYDDYEDVEDIWETYCEEYRAWYLSKIPDGRDFRLGRDEEFVEHIAGPHCEHRRGYNGNAISVEEMRLSTTVQCIVEKKSQAHDGLPEWSSEPDDEDFERESEYFLSGLGNKCGSWEDDTTVEPQRHGFNDLNPMHTEGFAMGDLAFHPHCLEMYKRVSSLRLGRVDIAAFADWWDRGGEDVYLPDHPAVDAASNQYWTFNEGDEYLAANPLEIPALTSILESARRPPSYDARSSPFDAGSTTTTTTTTTTDPISNLPSELRDMVLSYLPSKDIANLRLASKTFRYLPNTLWHDLLQKEMPWIWETWTDQPYPYMSCTTKRELQERRQAGKPAIRLARGGEATSRQKQLVAQADAEFRRPREVRRLERLRTDWYYLYCRIRREWGNINGLQNRERIWKCVEYVVRRVADPDEDLEFVKTDHERRFPHRLKKLLDPETGETSSVLMKPRDWVGQRAQAQAQADFLFATEDRL